MSRSTVLNFYCNICTRELTDNDAIFTSCGHLFCTRGCTGLNSGERGRCDFCGQDCETCSLCGQGLGLPDETRRYLFFSLEEELQQLINIVAYHKMQQDIYVQNVRNIIQKKNEQVKKAQEEAKAGQNAMRQMELYREEISRLKNEVQALASENQELKRKRSYSDPKAKSPSMSNYSLMPRSTEHTPRARTCISPMYRPGTNDFSYRTPHSDNYNSTVPRVKSPFSLDTARQLRTKGYSLQRQSEGSRSTNDFTAKTFRPTATPDLLKTNSGSRSNFYLK